MTTKRIALFGSTTHVAILACAAAIDAVGGKPQYRNEHAYNPHPSQHEPFDAVVVVDASEPAQLVIDTHRERDVTVFVIADVQTREALLADHGAQGFFEYVGEHLEEQKLAIDDTLIDLKSIADQSAVIADLPKIADLAGVLEQLDAEGVTALQSRDVRKTAAPIYAARLAALAPAAPAAPQEPTSEQGTGTPADGQASETGTPAT